MENEIKVGGRVCHVGLGGEGTVKDLDTFADGAKAACVKWDDGAYIAVRSSSLALIPDTVMVEMTREDVEWWETLDGLGTIPINSRLYAACKKALEGESE